MGEHLDDLRRGRRDAPGDPTRWPGGVQRLPSAGNEAHFQRGDIEYQLGAVHHELAEYKAVFAAAGFVEIETSGHEGDNELAALNPEWARYRGFPMLVVFRMTVPG